MNKGDHPFYRRHILFLTMGILVAVGSTFSQGQNETLQGRWKEIVGEYELRVQGVGVVNMKLLFKDGKLLSYEEGDNDPTLFEPVEGKELEFVYRHATRGLYHVTFTKDAQGKYTRLRAVNETIGFEATGKKKKPLEESFTTPELSRAERLAYMKEHYSKSEQLVPMRDGVGLYTQIYAPRDPSDKYPIILIRSPYGIMPYDDVYRNEMYLSWHFVEEKYIFVYQDVRGRFMSEGEFVNMRPYIVNKKSPQDIDASSDTYDTVEWLLKNESNHNGKVGIWGISYLGFYAAMAAMSGHPAVVAVSPQAPMADLFLGDDGHHYGAFYLAHVFRFMGAMGMPREERTKTWPPDAFFRYPTPDGYAFFLNLGPLKNFDKQYFKGKNVFWNAMMEHGAYDAFWKERSIYSHLRGIRPAVMTVGGWYDVEDLLGTLQTYAHIEKQNPGLQNTLVMGPWRHGGWNHSDGDKFGVIEFGSKTAKYFAEQVEFPFFNYHLKGKGSLDLPEALVFETGSNVWRSYDSWPPRDAVEKNVYLHSGGTLSFDEPTATDKNSYDEYISDPHKPVPFTTITHNWVPTEYMVEDQRFAASRTDVLVYQTEILTQDVTITGPITATLFVSTSGTDADWVVKVIDVFPDSTPDPKWNPKGIRMGGYQLLVRGDVIRGKFRNSFEKPEPFKPNEVTKVQFDLPDMQHRFLRGHKMMVQIQNSWFPMIDRNPQTYCDIYNASESDFQKAVQRVYWSEKYPSHITLRTVSSEE